MPRPKKTETDRKTFKGIEVIYESEEGRSFVKAYCPLGCGHVEEGMILSMDIGKNIAGRIQTHMKEFCPRRKE